LLAVSHVLFTMLRFQWPEDVYFTVVSFGLKMQLWTAS